MMAKGTLFNDPTKLKTATVVLERNHREAKLMPKDSKALMHAATIKFGFCKAGSDEIVVASPLSAMSAKMKGKLSRLL